MRQISLRQSLRRLNPNFSKNNYLLLIVMMLSCVGMFAFFPYVVVELPIFSGISVNDIGF